MHQHRRSDAVGAFWGFIIAEVDGLKTIVATGDGSELTSEASRRITEIRPDLTLVGLLLIYQMNLE